MKNVKKRILAAVVLIGISVMIGYGSQGKNGFEENEIVKINGLPVCREEFSLVMEENRLQYERELAEEFQIPQDIEAEQYFSGEDDYWRKIVDKNVEKLCRIKVQQKLAQDRGLAEVFKWEVFLKQLEEENILREEKVKNGEVIYGLTNFGKEEFYTYQVDAMVNKLRNDILQEKGGEITKEEILKYYQQQELPLSLEGERYVYTMCEVTELMDEKNGDTVNVLGVLAEKLRKGTRKDQKYLDTDGTKYRLETREMNQGELRELVRSDLNGEAILILSEGQVSEPVMLEGKYWLVRYEGLRKADILSESDQMAVKNTMLDDRFNNFIEQQAEEAVVEINEEGLYDFISEEERK